MSDPSLGQVIAFGVNFAPKGSATRDGQPMPINQNQARYSPLGHVFGGDGNSSFSLPDLRGRSLASRT